MTQLAEAFARSLAAKDARTLAGLMHPQIDFQAMTPRKIWDAASPQEIVDDVIFGNWFEPTDNIEALDHVECDAFADRERVGYRLRVTNPDGTFLVDQQAYFGTDGERITWLRIMCSGYRPIV